MPVLGVTGGIATGKSTFVRTFLSHFSAELFDSDECAHELLANDPLVREAVIGLFGSAAYDADGKVVRQHLRERVFTDPALRQKLEAILHPRIRARWQESAQASRENYSWLCVDIPLLYETGAEAHFDRTIVVACSPDTQRRRLREARGLSDLMAEAMIAAQFDLRAKISKADHLIWNDSTSVSLEGQARLLAGWLRNRYG